MDTETRGRLTIQDVARETGLSAHTLRYYERAGLLSPIQRTGSGHRTYVPEDLSYISLVVCLRESGLPIREVRHFADLCRDGDHTIPERIAVLRAQVESIARQRSELDRNESVLRGKLETYLRHPSLVNAARPVANDSRDS